MSTRRATWRVRVVGHDPQGGGPRGPARHAKSGAVALAQATGAPLVPAALTGHPA